MAVTDAYAAAAEYRAAADKSSAGEDSEIDGDLTAVSRWLDKRFGMFWTKDASAVDRTFEACYPSILDVPEGIVSVVSIKIDEDSDGGFGDETAIAAGDYELLPRNAALGSEPQPYRQIGLTSWGAKQSFPAGALVRVNGVFGWPAVPGAIKRATIHLTAILRLETSRADAMVSDLGQIVQKTPQARHIIDELARMYGRPLAGVVVA